jgi:hypothetical protein
MKKEYRGHTIEVNEHMLFVITAGPLLERNEETTGRYSNDTYQGITEYIDRGLTAAEREKRIKIALPVLDEAGTKKTITGLNARTGYLTGVGDTSYVYPDIDWIKDALAEIAKINQRSKVIRSNLEPFRIKTNYTYLNAARNYEDEVQKLQAEHTKKTLAADKARTNVSTKTT